LITHLNYLLNMNKLMIGAFALAALVAAPVATMAADYAYVNTNGEVSMVSAVDANTALMTAPKLHVHSGVMLLGSDNSIVGDDVNGI